MIRIQIGCAIVCFFLTQSVSFGQLRLGTTETALDRYVAKPDDTFEWKVVHEDSNELGTFYVVDLKSQTWRTKKDVDRTVWQHWLRIVKPLEVKSDTALLFISGGSNGGNPPKTPEQRLLKVAAATKTVVIELGMIPNQPLVFHDDGITRTEDDLIAYTWDQYLKTNDETWPARLPMVKSVVRAMDAVQELLNADQANPLVKDFVVAGGSKRGWTTWMTAAVEKRVAAIAPIVIDVLNVKTSMDHHYSAYGFWAPAVGDYVEHKLTHRRDWPEYTQLLKIVDPYEYRDRLTMPKCIINSAGDQFFLPDSSQFYYDDLPGETHLCYVPNSDHSLNGTNALDTLLAFHHAIAYDVPRPKFSWTFETEQAIVVTPETQPAKVLLWQATNPDARDFRLEKIGKAYRSLELTKQTDGSYRGEVRTPDKGWTAFFVQLEFDTGAATPMRLTTAVGVTPKTLPYSIEDAPTLPRP